MPAKLSLSLISGPDAARLETRVVDGYEFTLGRGQDADWSLLDPEKNILSRRHCMLSLEDGDWWVVDLSANGTYVNHETTPVGDGRKHRLRDGDRIRLGAYEFQTLLSGAEPARPVYRPDTVGQTWPPVHSPVSPEDPLFGANPFDDDGEAPPVAYRPRVQPRDPRGGASPPPAVDRPVATGVAGAANPFSDDGQDDGWPAAEASAEPGNRGVGFGGALGGAAAMPARPVAAPPVADRANPFLDSPIEAPAAVPPVPSAEPVPPPNPARPREAARAVEAANPFAEPGDAPSPARPMAGDTQTRPLADTGVPAARVERQAAAPQAISPEPVAPPPAPPLAVSSRAAAPPPAAATAPAEVSAPPREAALVAALLQGAGLPDAAPRDPEQAVRALGAAFRAMVSGLRDVQRARRTVRGGFRIAQTAWTENPLKVAVSDDDALEALLGAGRRSAMPPARAVEEVLKEIVLHEVATVAAMQEAVRALLQTLAPEKLRETAEQGAGLTLLPAQRKARAWDTYEATHARITAALQDDFDSVFGRAFARAYERVIADQDR
jgi:predicted component of type VI protein secretion system